MQCLTALIESDNWEEIVGRCHAHEELSFPLVHAFQANIWTKRNLWNPPFTKNHSSTDQTTSSASHKLGPWVTKIIPDLAWFFNGFLLEIWTYTLTFPYVNQGPLLKASKGHIKILGSWCWLFLLHILWLDRDPFFSCMYSGLPEVLFFFLYYYYYCFFFLLFGTLGLHGPF